jgi:RNA polymerase sigma-70 factor, ECF subfamily
MLSVNGVVGGWCVVEDAVNGGPVSPCVSLGATQSFARQRGNVRARRTCAERGLAYPPRCFGGGLRRMSEVLASIEASIPALRRYARALLRNPQDADDLVHDVLVRALDRMHTRHPDAAIRPWLFAIMHNLHVSSLRRSKVRGNIVPMEAVNDAQVSAQPAQEADLHCQETMQAFNLLPPEQQQVLLLVSVEDLSYAEVSAVLGIPIGTVMSRLSRGRERLRHLMGDEALPAFRSVK